MAGRRRHHPARAAPADAQRWHGDRITGQAYYVVKQAIAALGADASKFGSHSMRSGGTSIAAKNGASLWKTKEISRHKSTDVLAGYIREAELFQQHASVGMYWGGEMAGLLWLARADLGLPLDKLPWLAVEKIRTWVVDRSQSHALRFAGHTAGSRSIFDDAIVSDRDRKCRDVRTGRLASGQVARSRRREQSGWPGPRKRGAD
jgi:hypothetical protein